MSDKPLVTVLDPLTWDYGWSYEIEKSQLAARGIDLVVPADPKERDRLVRKADVIVSSGLIPVDIDLISTFDRCLGIVCYSSGMDAVDIDAAEDAGITVANVQANTVDVADHAMALLLALRRLIVPMTAATEEGNWDLRQFPEVWDIPRLMGQTLGVVGAGRVGREVAVRARSFGMKTIANYHTPPTKLDPELPHLNLHDLVARSDAIVLCASLKPDSYRMINAEVLARIKQGSVLVNVARGSLIDEPALIEALDTGRLAGAALDVRDPEPPSSGDPLSGRPNVIQTPHMAGASSRALIALHEIAAETIIRLLDNSKRREPTDVPNRKV